MWCARWTSQRRAERLREIMTDLVNRAAVVVQRYGGTVGGFTGDGVMAVFGAPTALEDHAVRACLAAQKPDLARTRPARRRTAHLDPAAGLARPGRPNLGTQTATAAATGRRRAAHHHRPPTHPALLPTMALDRSHYQRPPPPGPADLIGKIPEVSGQATV